MEAEATTRAGFWRPVAALTHRDFRLFWGGQCISLLGTWTQTVAQAWLVLELTDSSFLLGVVGAVQFAPIMALSWVTGAVADRVAKRRLLFATQGTMMLVALLLGVLSATGAIRYWHILVLAAVLGTATAFDVPARQSYIIHLVGRRDLMNAIALNSSIFNGARFLGPALAGLVVARWGVTPCFFINAASFVAVLAGLALVRAPGLPAAGAGLPGGATAFLRIVVGDAGGGLRYILETPAVRGLLLLLGSLSLVAMNFHILVPVFAREVIGGGPRAYGFLLSATGLGALLGAVSLAAVSHRGPRRSHLWGSAVGLCLFQLCLWFVDRFALACPLLLGAGFCMISLAALVNTSLQLITPDHLRGRVMAAYFLVFAGVAPLGSLFSGGLARLVGAPGAFGVGALCGLTVIGVVVLLRGAGAATCEQSPGQ
ncbi:MAG: MFS transporter [Desulfotomaculales bacterium]